MLAAHHRLTSSRPIAGAPNQLGHTLGRLKTDVETAEVEAQTPAAWGKSAAHGGSSSRLVRTKSTSAMRDTERDAAREALQIFDSPRPKTPEAAREAAQEAVHLVEPGSAALPGPLDEVVKSKGRLKKGIKPPAMSVADAMRHVVDIYEARFRVEAELAEEAGGLAGEEEASNRAQSLPEFARDCFIRKYGIKSLAVKHLRGLKGLCESPPPGGLNTRLSVFAMLMGIREPPGGAAAPGAVARGASDEPPPTRYHPFSVRIFFKMMRVMFAKGKDMAAIFYAADKLVPREQVVLAVASAFTSLRLKRSKDYAELQRALVAMEAKTVMRKTEKLICINLDDALAIAMERWPLEWSLRYSPPQSAAETARPMDRIRRCARRHFLARSIFKAQQRKRLLDLFSEWDEYLHSPTDGHFDVRCQPGVFTLAEFTRLVNEGCKHNLPEDKVLQVFNMWHEGIDQAVADAEAKDDTAVSIHVRRRAAQALCVGYLSFTCPLFIWRRRAPVLFGGWARAIHRNRTPLCPSLMRPGKMTPSALLLIARCVRLRLRSPATRAPLGLPLVSSILSRSCRAHPWRACAIASDARVLFPPRRAQNESTESAAMPGVQLGTTGAEVGAKYFAKTPPAKLRSMDERMIKEAEQEERKHNEMLEQWQTKRGELYDNFMESGFGADDHAAAITIEVRAARVDDLYSREASLSDAHAPLSSARVGALQGDAPWDLVSQAFVKAMWDNGIYA